MRKIRHFRWLSTRFVQNKNDNKCLSAQNDTSRNKL